MTMTKASARSRLTAGTGALALALSALALGAVPASADHNGPSPSDSEELCEEAGGEFDDLGDGVTRCTVVKTKEVHLPSNKDADWTVIYDRETTIVYTTTVTKDWVVTGAACYNRAGNVVGGWSWQSPTMGNPNCVEAWENNGHQPNPPFFYIEETGEWVKTVEHDKDVTVDWTRTGCLNPQDNPIGGWENNPHCFADLP